MIADVKNGEATPEAVAKLQILIRKSIEMSAAWPDESRVVSRAKLGVIRVLQSLDRTKLRLGRIGAGIALRLVQRVKPLRRSRITIRIAHLGDQNGWAESRFLFLHLGEKVAGGRDGMELYEQRMVAAPLRGGAQQCHRQISGFFRCERLPCAIGCDKDDCIIRGAFQHDCAVDQIANCGGMDHKGLRIDGRAADREKGSQTLAVSGHKLNSLMAAR